MGLSEKVIIALVITALVQIACRHCMPSISRKASLKRYLDNLKPDKNNPSSTSCTPSPVNKLTKQTVRKRIQNGRVNNNSVPQKSLYDTFNFPHNDFPVDNSPRDPFRFGKLNANYKVNTQRRPSPNPQCSAINDLKKDMKRKRKLLSNRQINDANRLSENETPSMKMALGSDSTHLLDQGKFPEVQYPLTTMETWEPKYWNCLPFTQDEKQFNSFQRETFKPNVKDNKPLTRLTKTKANKFLKPYDVLKGKQQRTSTENSKRSSTDQQGLNFTKTATCEKVTDEFISAGLVSMLPKNVSVSQTTLKRENITKMENKCEITEYTLDSQLNTNKKVDDLENMCPPLELKNNTDESNELMNIINEILKLESIEDEAVTTASACNSSAETEKSVDKLDLAIDDSINESISLTPIDNTSSCIDANASEELLMTVSNDELADEKQNTTLPLPAEPERGNITCVEDTSNVSLPLSVAENVTTTTSTNPTEVSLSSNGNAVAGSTSIIIIPINNNVVGKSQSHVITGTPDKPIIVYIPSTQSSNSHTQNLPSEQYVSLSLEKFMQDNHIGNAIANMAPLQNFSSTDLVSEILNCDSHNGSSLPMYETLPINSMCYNNESNLSSILVRESASLEPDSNEKIHKQSEDLYSEIISSETLPQIPDFEHPLLDFPGSEFTFLSHGSFNDHLTSELPIITREITNVPSEDLCLVKHNVTSQTLLKNEGNRDLDVIVEKDLTPLSKTYIDGAKLESNMYVLPVCHADDTEIVKNIPPLPEIEQYSLPVTKDEQTSSSSEEPANNEPSPVELFKSAEVSVPTALSLDSSPVDLPEITKLPLTQGSHETTDNARQPMENSASLPSTSNNLLMTTDTTLESALLPEFNKISLLLDKMLAHLETFTTNSKIVPISEPDISPQPVTTSQVPTDSLPLPVDITMKPLEETETLIESLEPSLGEAVPSTPPIESLKILPLSLDEPNDPYSLSKPSAPLNQPNDKIAAISPIKEPEPISQISSDSIILPADNNMFKPEIIVESALKSLQEINQQRPSTPVFESSSFPSNSLVRHSDGPSQLSHDTLSPIPDSNSFQNQIKNAEGSQLPISKTYINSIEQLTNQLIESAPVITSSNALPLPESLLSNSFSRQSENLPDDMNNVMQLYLDSDRPILQVTFPQLNSQISSENLCLPVNKKFEPEVTEKPVESSELKMDKSCPPNCLIIQTHSEPNSQLHPTAGVNNVPPPIKQVKPISQNFTDAQCLPLNKTYPTLPRFEASIQSLQQQIDKSVPSISISDSPTNNRCPLNHTSLSTNSVLETSDNIPLDEICLLAPASGTTTDYKKSDTDNLVTPMSQSKTAKDASTITSHFHGSTVESSDVPLKMDLLLPDIFEDRDDLPFTVNTEPTIKSLTTPENNASQIPETVTLLSEFPVCDQSNATEMLLPKIALENVTSDEMKYNIPENNLISDWSDYLTQEASSNDDSLLIANDTSIEIPYSDDVQEVLPQIEHFLSSEDNVSPEFSGIEFLALNKDQQPAINQIGDSEVPLISDAVHDGSPSHTILLLSDDSLDDLPSPRHKPYSASTIILTKALLESLLSEIEKREFALPVTAVPSVKSAKLIDQTKEVEPSLSGMTQARFPEESNSEEDKKQSDLDLFANLTDFYQLCETEDILTLPEDNILSNIPNLQISEEITPPIHKMHVDKSDITTDELFHKELDIPSPSDNVTVQLTSSAFISPEDNKRDIPLARDEIGSRLLLTKAILENVASDLSQKEMAFTSPSMLDKTTSITNSEVTDYTSKTYTDKILENTVDSDPQINYFQSSSKINDAIAELNETTLSEIPSSNSSQELPSPIETTDQDDNDKTHNSDHFFLSNDANNSGTKDMFDKSSDSPSPLLSIPKAMGQSVLPDNELLGDKDFSISSTMDKTKVIEDRPSQLSIDKNPPYTVLSDKATDKLISEKSEDITLRELAEKLIENIHVIQQDDKQNRNKNVLFENSTDDLALSNGDTLPHSNEKVVKIGPSFSKLQITKALLESVLSDVNARLYLLPIATTRLDKMHYNISPTLETIAKNPSQLLADTKPEKEQNVSEADEMLSEDIQMLDDKHDSDESILYPLSDLPPSIGDISHFDEKLDEAGPSASKLLITRALLESVLSDINTRGFSLLSKDLPKKSVLDKTLYFVEPSLSDIIDESPPSPVDESYHDYKPDSETYYVLTLPADNSIFDKPTVDSPMDQISKEKIEILTNDEEGKIENDESPPSPVDESYHDYKPDSETYYVLTLPADNSMFDRETVESPMDQISKETLEILTDDEEGKIENLALDTEDNDLSQEIGEILSLADDVHETPRAKPYLASKILITKALLEKVLSDITDGALSANALPVVPIS